MSSKKTVYLYLWVISSNFKGNPIYHVTCETTEKKLKEAFIVCDKDEYFNYDKFMENENASIMGNDMSFGIIKLEDFGKFMERNIKNTKLKKVWNETCGDIGDIGKIETDYDIFCKFVSTDNIDFKNFVQKL
uniref:Uncharacterized protein n=1 Tax=Mimivirus LCMiAC02 TaxID=2506609 RepID=A0A4P6VQM0_9VIRU|nr:MAG: hypothetical protein LCMiAC02_04700 [Mimivirus LCMiAC02]